MPNTVAPEVQLRVVFLQIESWNQLQMKEGHYRKEDQLSRVYATMQQPIVDAESRRVDERAECGHADATFPNVHCCATTLCGGASWQFRRRRLRLVEKSRCWTRCIMIEYLIAVLMYLLG